MASAGDSLNNWRRANPNQVLAIGVSALVIGVSLWLGMQARGANAELAVKRDALREVSNQLATIQQQFRVPTATESAALIAESGRLGALGVPESERLNLLDSVGRLAEACALTQVRVSSVAPGDSIFIAPRIIGTQSLDPASYAVSIEFSGGFAGVVKFVNSLPPSVSVSRFSASRRGSETRYQMTLSVYQHNANNAG